MNRRKPRLELIAGLSFALAVSAFGAVAARAQAVSTTTKLAAQSSASGGCSLTSLAVDVTSASDTPSGSVSIQDDAGSAPVTLASAPLNSSGQASFTFALENGAHSLSAVYAGSTDFQGSTSTAAPVTINSQCDSTLDVYKRQALLTAFGRAKCSGEKLDGSSPLLSAVQGSTTCPRRGKTTS